MESSNEFNVYCREAKWALGNSFPRIRVQAIKAVFDYSGQNFTDAFLCLAKIEARRTSIDGLGQGEFEEIPSHIKAFIKQDRKTKRFQLTSEKLCAERDTLAEVQLNGERQKSCDEKVLSAIEQVKKLAEESRNMLPHSQHGIVEHIMGDSTSDFFKAMLDLRKDFIEANKPGYIDIGFHYTSSANLPSIQRSGLLSKGDRTLEKVTAARNHGEVFGL